MALPIVQALGGLILLGLVLLSYYSTAGLKSQLPPSPQSSCAPPCCPQRSLPHPAVVKAPLVPGAWLQGYRVEALLGQGGYGCVYRASAPSGVPVALKIVRNLEAGYQEALVLCHLSHPGIPWLKAGFPTPSGYCLVQEYIRGETLRERLHRCGGRLPVVEVLRLGVQLAAILADLHHHPQPILHQDVKPENAIVTPRGTVKLLDFGLAVPVGAGWPVRGGTLAYMAPEQLKGCADPRSDVYALGVTLWELLCGQFPIPSANEFPPLPADTPGALRRLLQQMLDLRSDQRLSAWEVAHILRRLAIQSQRGGPLRCA